MSVLLIGIIPSCEHRNREANELGAYNAMLIQSSEFNPIKTETRSYYGHSYIVWFDVIERKAFAVVHNEACSNSGHR